jgi:hypothetical protein
MSTWRLRPRFDATKVDAPWLLLSAVAVAIVVLYLACWLSDPGSARWP